MVLLAKASVTLCREARQRQRELAHFSVACLTAQNGVKFKPTNAVKVFAELFSSCEAISQKQTVLLYRLKHTDKLQFMQKG